MINSRNNWNHGLKETDYGIFHYVEFCSRRDEADMSGLGSWRNPEAGLLFHV